MVESVVAQSIAASAAIGGWTPMNALIVHLNVLLSLGREPEDVCVERAEKTEKGLSS